MSVSVSDDPLDFDEFRAFCEALEADGLTRLSPRWGITKAALMRAVGRPQRVVKGSDTDSAAKLYRLADGAILWDVALYSQDGADGVPYFSDEFILSSPAIAERGRAIEQWLDANPDAYELFVPIRWARAPDRAREALRWLLAHEDRLAASPLAEMYADLRRELEASVGDAR